MYHIKKVFRALGMGLYYYVNNIFAIDCMLGTRLMFYLLFSPYIVNGFCLNLLDFINYKSLTSFLFYNLLRKLIIIFDFHTIVIWYCQYTIIRVLYNLRFFLDAIGSLNLLLNSQNDNGTILKNMNIQSAENCKGFSETTRQLSNSFSYPKGNDTQFISWLAGIMDGDGNFDIINNKIHGKKILKAIRIKLHNRDVRILTRIQNGLHMGKIKVIKNKPYSLYVISDKASMYTLISKLNGLIRIKVHSFKIACTLYDINFIEPNYNINPYDPYFSGLIDTDGSIVFNFTGNRIECHLELKYNEYSSKLNFDNVIPNYKPYKILRVKSNQTLPKFQSIAFKFQTVKGMLPLYDYFMKNRLYSDFKFYRISQIKKFLDIRKYQNAHFESVEYLIYSDFVLN